jgi:hypothetical protein
MTFTRKVVTYKKSYEETTIKLLISKVRGLKLENTIKFPSGLIAPHADGVARNVHNGMLIWSTEELPCTDTMSLMYQGRAKLHQAKSNIKANLEEAIILVEQHETRRYVGLVLEVTRSLCGHFCHNTQIQNVVACLETEDPNRDWKFLKALDHETVNLLTHMHFLHLSRGLGNFRRFKEFQEAVCQVERKGLFNKLQALASGNKYALHNIYGPGFQIYLAVSVAYVTQCIPVEARLYEPLNCTQQILAEIGSKEYGNVTRKYANAQTMILQDIPTKVPCTRQYPPKWKIEDRWYCSFPIVQECNEAPTQLNLTYDHTFYSMWAIFNRIKGGILTATQLQGSRLWRQLAQCQEAVSHALAYTALYNSPNQVTLNWYSRHALILTRC